MSNIKSLADRNSASYSSGRDVRINLHNDDTTVHNPYRRNFETTALMIIIIMMIALFHLIGSTHRRIDDLHDELEFVVSIMQETDDPVILAKIRGYYGRSTIIYGLTAERGEKRECKTTSN